jgi:hypothetical protein
LPARHSASFDHEIIRDTILDLDRIVERDIKDLQAECHRHEDIQSRLTRSDYEQQQRSRSVDTRRQCRPPPPPPPLPPRSTSTSATFRTAEERRLYEHRVQTAQMITSRTHSAPRVQQSVEETSHPLKKLDTNISGPVTMLCNIPLPPCSRSSSSSSLSTETTLRVSSPEPDDQPNETFKPLYITEIIVPAKPIVHLHEPIKTTVITITDNAEVECRNRDIERLEYERRTLLTEKQLLLQEIDRYKQQASKIDDHHCFVAFV